MPATPLHYLAAYFLDRLFRGRFNLPALAVGTLIPDLEIPTLALLNLAPPHNRLILHSIVGGATLGTLITVFVVVFLYRRVVMSLLPLDGDQLKAMCRLSPRMVASGAMGVLTHVLVDATHHEYNPLFYPFTYASIDNFLLFGDVVLASIAVHILFLAYGIHVLRQELSLGRGFWSRLLIATGRQGGKGSRKT